MYLDGKYLRKETIQARDYQTNIARSCLLGPTLVVLPTGLGKTVIALIVMDGVLERTSGEGPEVGGKVLILAPTRPLVDQHKGFFSKCLDGIDLAAFTGDLSPDQRESIWRRSRVIISTPQVIQNDILTGRYDLGGVSLLIFDEAHRARGNYSYVNVAELYRKQRKARGLKPFSMGMTASPGSTLETILDVCRNLGLGRTEVRTEEDEDVAPYVHDISTRWRVVDLPAEHKQVAKALRAIWDRLVSELQDAGFLDRGVNISTKSIITARVRIQDAIERCRRIGPSGLGIDREDEISCLIRLSLVQSKLMTLGHALELAETQGPETLRAFVGRLQDRTDPESSSRSAEELLTDPSMVEALSILETVTEPHPKIQAVKDVLIDQFSRRKDSRVIVFAHYRDTSEVLIRELLKIDGMLPCRFVGQSNRGEDKGLTQKEQSEIIEKFRRGDINVLVATSVAEEGLDIPSTDMVVFYEPVPSEIRAIQRRGRTGRSKAGRVEIMMTRQTKDEAAYWASRAKEKRMRSEIEQLRAGLKEAFSPMRPLPPLAPIAAQQHDPAKAQDLVSREEPSGVNADGLMFPWARTEKKEVLLGRSSSQLLPPLSGPPMIIDNREVPTSVAMELNRLGAQIEPAQLDIGDYVLSDRVAIERKTTRDFLDSLLDGRLFSQLKALRSAYSRPLLVIEGEDLRSDRNVSPAAIDGAISVILIDLGIPVLRTRDAAETASLLVRISAREHAERRPLAVRKAKHTGELRSKLRLVIEGLPSVSATLSDRLLTHFGSVVNIMNASIEQLQEVRGVGPLTAVAIYRLVRAKYTDGDDGRPRPIEEPELDPGKDNGQAQTDT